MSDPDLSRIGQTQGGMSHGDKRVCPILPLACVTWTPRCGFYRDLLGFEVVRDEVQATRGTVLPALYQEPHDQRRVATLYWKKGPYEAFLVLSEHSDKPASGEPIKLDQIGIHHYAFWVENLPQVYEELKAKGADFVRAADPSPKQQTATLTVPSCATRTAFWSSLTSWWQTNRQPEEVRMTQPYALTIATAAERIRTQQLSPVTHGPILFEPPGAA